MNWIELKNKTNLQVEYNWDVIFKSPLGHTVLTISKDSSGNFHAKTDEELLSMLKPSIADIIREFINQDEQEINKGITPEKAMKALELTEKDVRAIEQGKKIAINGDKRS